MNSRSLLYKNNGTKVCNELSQILRTNNLIKSLSRDMVFPSWVDNSFKGENKGEPGKVNVEDLVLYTEVSQSMS